jgi:hypothetical protein
MSMVLTISALAALALSSGIALAAAMPPSDDDQISAAEPVSAHAAMRDGLGRR